jgi:hypothetical protein
MNRTSNNLFASRFYFPMLCALGSAFSACVKQYSIGFERPRNRVTKALLLVLMLLSASALWKAVCFQHSKELRFRSLI